MIDPLESRRLLSATFHANTGNLDVDGTSGDDVITFAKVNTSKGTRLHVTINGTTDSFNAAKIKVIKVTADDGNDSVTIGTIGIPSTVDGGAGDDALVGGDNRDKLIGGDGNDSLSGAAGNDTLIGGDGIDSSNGGDGDDLIIPDNGSNADDIIIGGAGNDTVDYSGSTIPVVLVLGTEPKPRTSTTSSPRISKPSSAANSTTGLPTPQPCHTPSSAARAMTSSSATAMAKHSTAATERTRSSPAKVGIQRAETSATSSPATAGKIC